MKIIKNLFKTIEQKSKLDLISELLVHGNTTIEALQLFDKVKANFNHEMKQREKQAAYECRMINRANLSTAKIFNPDFDKPLSEIEVNYEILNKK